MANLKPVHIDGCLPAPMRRSMDQLAERDEQLNAVAERMTGRPGPTYLNNQPASYYLDIANSTTTGPFPDAVILTMFQEGTLAGDLTYDSTATLNLFDPNTDAVYSPNRTITVDGFYVQQTPALKIATGTRVGAQWNGVCWRVIVSAKCMVPV
jgi:hypothetical protein